MRSRRLRRSPRPTSRATTRVLVIGAGLAGLTAAMELQKAELDVLVLEAQNRAGGRVLTLRSPFQDGAYAEAGARYILCGHRKVLQYASELGVPLDPLPRAPAAEPMLSYYVNGQKLRMRYADENPSAEAFAIRSDESRTGLAGLHEKYLAPMLAALGDPRLDDWSSPVHAGTDALTFRDFLLAQGASAGAIGLMSLGEFDTLGEGIDEVSALALLRREALLLGSSGGVFVVRAGSEQLPLAMARAVESRIRYGCSVRRIIQNADSVSVICERANHQNHQEAFTADFLIAALPFSVLRGIEIEPPLGAAKSEVVSQLPHTSVCRVYLQCRARFWKDECDLEQFMATDLPIMHLYHATAGQDAACGILEAYVVGPQARHMGAMSGPERIEFTLTHLERIFPTIRSHVLADVSYCWDADAWARGAFAWFRPHQLTRWAKIIDSRDGRIHFAGDHTSIFPGWMEGAMQSGVRAAQEILSRC